MAGAGSNAVKVGLLLGTLVAVVGYIGYSIVNRPKAGASTPAPVASPVSSTASDAAAGPPAAGSSVISLEPLSVSINPFRMTVSPAAPDQNTPQTGSARPAGVSEFGGLGGLPQVSNTTPLQVAPPESYGFRVLGVFVGDKPSALISYNGEAHLYSPGAKVADIKVVSIQAEGVRVRLGKDPPILVRVGALLGG